MEHMFDKLASISDNYLEETLARVPELVHLLLRGMTAKDIERNDLTWWILIIHNILDEMVAGLPLGERRTIIEEGLNVTAKNIPVELIAARSDAKIDAVAAAIRSRVTESKIGGLLGEDIIRAIEPLLLKNISDFVQDLDTSMSIYDRMFMQAIGNGLDTKYWKYAGPRDRKNRTFCAEVLDANEVYTDAGIEELNNKPSLHSYVPPNVKTLCGGYGCRHMFIPVSHE